MAAPIKDRKGNLSILASSVFCFIGIMFLSPPAWGGPSVIGFTSNQMATNGVQNLTVSGGCGGPYTWSIGSGGGSLSGSTGTSITYTAPSSNPNCENNPTITVMDACGFVANLTLAVNGLLGHAAGYYASTTFYETGQLVQNCALRSQGWCSYQTGRNTLLCNGNFTGAFTPCSSGHSEGACTADQYWAWGEAECEIEREQCNANCPAGCSPGFHDTRTSAELSGGCCPAELLPPPPPPPGCYLSVANGKTVNLSGGGRATFAGTISTDPGTSANWTIYVGGRIISGSGNSVSQFWDGRDSSDKQVEPGTYTAVLNAWVSGPGCTSNGEVPITVTSTPEQYLNVCVDSSINIANGNLYHSQTLFQVTNSKLLNDFVLSYNSLDGYSRILGTGWTHSYNINLKQNNDGSYTVLRGDGKRLVLYSNGNGGYTPQNSNYPSLTIKGDGTASLENKDGITYVFNQSGSITSLSERNGNTVTLAYDGSQNLTGITDPSGRNISFGYGQNNRISSITDPNGNTHNFTYTGQNLTAISSQISGLGVQNWSYSYDAKSFMLAKTDPKGFTTSYTYDSSHKLAQVTDPEGRTRAIASNPASSSSQFTEKDGGVWTYKYDSTIAALTERTDPLGNKTTYTYDSNPNLTSVTDPKGRVTSYTYDGNANVTSVTDALNNTTTYTYNSLNKVTSIVYPGNASVTLTYDSHGNLTSITDPLNNLTQYGYDLRGNLSSVTGPLNGATILAYNPNSYLTSITDAIGAVTSFTYDAAGNVTRYTDPLGIITQFEYNGLNKIKEVTDPQGNVIIYTYDANGNVGSVTDANGKVTLYDYNYKGQATKIADALGGITQLAYGSGCPSCGAGVNKLTSLTDAKGHATTFQYNLVGGLIRETDALGNFKSYTYDPAGNRSSRTDEKGNITQYAFDNLNRLTGVSYPDGNSKTFAYDLRSNMTSAVNQDIGYSFSYDLNNRLTGISDSNGRSIDYKYDALGNRSQMTTIDGRTVSYAYNAVNRLTGILSTPGLLQFQFSYDLSGRRTGLSFPNGVTTTYSYSPSSYLTSLLAQKLPQNPVNSFSYAHDGMGNRTAMTDLSGVHNYTYDNIYQLIQATHPAQATPLSMPTEQFAYDSVGNRTSAEGESVGTPVATNYTYDWENRLLKVEYPGMVAQYKYDPFGRRIEKNVNGEITRYVYDGPNIFTEYDGNGNVKNAYIHNLAIDDPLAVQQDTNAYFYHKDGLGSVVDLTDGTGSVVNSYTYKSFGEIYSQTGSLQQPFTFTGREFDPESGLFYYRARYYDSKTGRFWTKDPVGLAGGDVNLYRYVKNNPLNYGDPSGMMFAPYHGIVTLLAALAEGYGAGSYRMAWEAMQVDFEPNAHSREAEFTNIHGMGGRLPTGGYQTPVEARRGAEIFMASQEKCNPGRASHTVQDLATPWHADYEWRGPDPLTNLDLVGHYAVDFFMSGWVAPDAYLATRRYLRSIRK